MDIDCKNRCGDRKKKGVNLMTGAELKEWISENNADNMEVRIDFDYAINGIHDIEIVKAQEADYVVLH